MLTTTPGRRRTLVTVDNPTRVADSDGGYTDTYAPATPATLFVHLQPMDGAERQRAGIVDTTITHLITGPYHAGVSTQTRLTVSADGRHLIVKAVRNLDDRQIAIELQAAEVPA